MRPWGTACVTAGLILGMMSAAAAPLNPGGPANPSMPSSPTPASLSSGGDPIRGAAIAASRSQGLCIQCHRFPGVQAHEAATIGPDLTGVASRLDPSTRRERLLHPERFNPETVMPSYARTRHPGHRVASGRQDQALLDAQGVADVLAWMSTLK